MASAVHIKVWATFMVTLLLVALMFEYSNKSEYFKRPQRLYAEDILIIDEQVKEKVQHLTGPVTKPDNTELVGLIRDYFIDNPRPYLTKLFKTDQAKTVDRILKEKKNGFFVECGALDGEHTSNTIWLEQERGWNGLLIEMDPSFYLQIRGKNRKCYSINACLSPKTHPVIIKFKEHKMGMGRLLDNQNNDGNITVLHNTYCFPFLSMMLALNVTHVDYFSLDVEGFELDILKTIPFDKIDISIFTVEYLHGPDGGTGYIGFMESKGYKLHSTIKAFRPEIYYGANDYVFVKEGIDL